MGQAGGPARGLVRGMFAAYIAVRVEGVPTLDPVREAQIFQFTTPTSVAAADNAADLYRHGSEVDLADASGGV